MKFILSLCILLFTAFAISAQPPEKMSYQAVIRNLNGELVTNQQVGMRISILHGSASGVPVYIERHTPTSNANGLVSLEIGTGTLMMGNFTSINWGNAPYFIQTETDPSGGTAYSITSTSQLLSVPYALYAKTAGSVAGGITETDPVFNTSVAAGITNADTSYWNHKQDRLTAGSGIQISGTTISSTGSTGNLYLGKDTLGGIIFCLYTGSDGLIHGLIVSKTETTARWQSPVSTTNAQSNWDGLANMGLMSNSPAKSWITSNFGPEWYLPSIDELLILLNNCLYVNKTLTFLGQPILNTYNTYWSSTEIGHFPTASWMVQLGSIGSRSKTDIHSVRAIRTF